MRNENIERREREERENKGGNLKYATVCDGSS